MKMNNSSGTNSQKNISPVVLVGIFLISLSALTLEIAFTRILSVVISYHYVFVVISMALLGLGLGGIIAYYTGRSRTELGAERMAWLAGLFSLSIPVSIVVMTSIGNGNLLLYSLLMLIPFFFAGMILSQAFTIYLYPGQSC